MSVSVSLSVCLPLSLFLSHSSLLLLRMTLFVAHWKEGIPWENSHFISQDQRNSEKHENVEQKSPISPLNSSLNEKVVILTLRLFSFLKFICPFAVDHTPYTGHQRVRFYGLGPKDCFLHDRTKMKVVVLCLLLAAFIGKLALVIPCMC